MSKSKSVINSNLSQAHVTMFGDSLWIKTLEMCNGAMENTIDKPLASDADLSKLKVAGMYYQQSRFEDKATGEPILQIVLLVEAGTKKAYYASILRNKDGEQLISEEDTYILHEVKAARDFVVPNATNADGSPVVIKADTYTVKAYAQ